MMQDDRPLAYYLRQALRDMGDGTYASEVEVRRAYNALVGPTIEKFTTSFSLKRGTLVVRLAAPALRYEILMRRTSLVRSINAMLKRQAVNKLVVL